MPEEKSTGHPTGHLTGPRTPEGKERSSQNARKHGCTSRKLILPGEREEEYRALLQDWLNDFQPQTPTARELVEQTAQAHWLYLRVLRQCDVAEAGMDNENLREWSEAEWKLRERLGRYRTSAERSFHRALTKAETERKSRSAEFYQMDRLEQGAQKLELQLLHWKNQDRIAEGKMALAQDQERARQAEREVKHAALLAGVTKPKPVSVAVAKKGKKPVLGVVEQWVEARITEGVTTTEYVPTNAELLEEIEKSGTEPEMVYRRMNFPDGLPPEYAWTNLHDPKQCEKTLEGVWCPLCSVHTNGGHGIQRMTFETWQRAIEREEKTPGGHAGPTGVGNLPQPEERGGDIPFAEMRKWVTSPEE